MAEGLKYEQEEIWAALQRLHARLVRLEVVHETKRSLPEFESGNCEPREELERIMARMAEKP